MRFETNFVRGKNYGHTDEVISKDITQEHGHAAELGGRVIAHVVLDGGVFITSALPETAEEEKILALVPSNSLASES